MQKILPFVIGYGVSLGVGYLITGFVSKELSKKYNIKRTGYEGLPALLGLCERILYTSAWIAGFKEFIVWWLLAKVGAGWIWQIAPKQIGPPGANYNVFLILNALSIVFGGLGALIILHWP